MADNTEMTPKALAEELEMSPKVLRAYLRQNFTRTTEEKNTSWKLDAETVKAVREHYASKAKGETKDEEVAEVEAKQEKSTPAKPRTKRRVKSVA